MVKSKQNIIKSKLRVQNFGEVFTSEKEVENMVSLFSHELDRPDSRFLEPACGEGNFLDNILNKKLNFVINKYKKNQFDSEKYSLLALSSLYGIDIIEDNVLETRKRLEKTIIDRFKYIFAEIKDEFIRSIKFILKKNIIHGDALTLTLVKLKKPIVFSEWSFFNSTMIKRRDFTFKHLIETRPFEGFNLFSDLGEEAFIPEPVREYPPQHFLKIDETSSTKI